jgi:hypothetical protein
MFEAERTSQNESTRNAAALPSATAHCSSNSIFIHALSMQICELSVVLAQSTNTISDSFSCVPNDIVVLLTQTAKR